MTRRLHWSAALVIGVGGTVLTVFGPFLLPRAVQDPLFEVIWTLAITREALFAVAFVVWTLFGFGAVAIASALTNELGPDAPRGRRDAWDALRASISLLVWFGGFWFAAGLGQANWLDSSVGYYDLRLGIFVQQFTAFYFAAGLIIGVWLRRVATACLTCLLSVAIGLFWQASALIGLAKTAMTTRGLRPAPLLDWVMWLLEDAYVVYAAAFVAGVAGWAVTRLMARKLGARGSAPAR